MTFLERSFLLTTLFTADDLNPTPLTRGLALPSPLLKATRAAYIAMLGGPQPWKFTRHAGATDALAWKFDVSKRPHSLTLVTLPWNLAAVPLGARLDCIDAARDALGHLQGVTTEIAREFVRIAREAGASGVDMADLEAYARALGVSW